MEVAIKLSQRNVNNINPIDKIVKIENPDININLSFFGFLEINVAIALGKDKLEREINKTIKGLTNENSPIASTPSSRFIMILLSKEMNFALKPRNITLTKYNV